MGAWKWSSKRQQGESNQLQWSACTKSHDVLTEFKDHALKWELMDITNAEIYKCDWYITTTEHGVC